MFIEVSWNLKPETSSAPGQTVLSLRLSQWEGSGWSWKRGSGFGGFLGQILTFWHFELGGLFFFSTFFVLSPRVITRFFESFFCWRDGWIYWVYFVDQASLMIIEWPLWEDSPPFGGFKKKTLPLQLSKGPFESLNRKVLYFGEFVHVSPMSRLWLSKALITVSPLECIYCIYPPPSNSHHQVLTFLGSWTPRNLHFPLLLVKDRFNLCILVIWESCSQGNDSESGFSIHSQFWWNFLTLDNSLIHQLGMDDTN